MEREIKIRRKKIFVWILVMSLLWNQVIPTIVQAADYNNIDKDQNAISDKQILLPGDVINRLEDSTLLDPVSDISITYYDSISGADGARQKLYTVSITSDVPSHTVMKYTDVLAEYKSETPEVTYQSVLSEETFGGWKVNEFVASGGYIISFSLTAFGKYAITYDLNGGTNSSENPSTYVEGIGVAKFASPTRNGYTFEGWYSDEACTEDNKVTEINSEQTGNVTLYAKWIPKEYLISYVLDGGTVEGENPESYIVGTRISEFAPANKTGYDFVGWYDAETDGNHITSITEEQFGEIKLYARYKASTYKIEYVLNDGTNAADNPESYTYGVGVTELAPATKKGHTFVGWYSDADFTNPVTSIGKETTGEVTLYAKFTVDSYTITYELNGGENGAGNPGTYTYGEGVSSFANASKEGYTFKGWFTAADGGEKIESISKEQTGTVTLYARYEANTYEITYELNGGTHASNNPNSYIYGVGVSEFADATKPGYVFDGWYSDEDFTNKVTSISEEEIEAVTLYAKFTIITYIINYQLDGGDNSTDNPLSYTCDMDAIKLKEASKLGYTFDGWYSDANYTTKVETIDTSKLQDVNLYAKFTANKYTITYNENGGTNADTNPAEYTYGVGVTGFADASRDGYTFEGWYKEATFATKVTEIKKTEMGNLILYAKFTPNTYSITYELDGGNKGNGNPENYTVGTGVSSFADASKAGYTFNGWFSSATDGTKITSISDTQYGDIILYAQYTANTYTIKYELEGGINGENNPTEYTYGKGVDIFADASKDGHTFEGWYSDANYTTKVTEIGKEEMGNLTLYAKFTPNTYKITYELDGGKNAETNPSTYTYGEGVASLATPTKTGHTFVGWYTAADINVESISTTQTEDVTLYAKWTVNSYNIFYKDMDGKELEVNELTNPSTFTFGTEVSSIGAVEKIGHTFAGWYTAAEGGTKIESISGTQAEDVTLYARFTANSYEIDYELNGGSNGEGNPDSYTYGIGVDSFANASKNGHTFDGWYSDADFTNPVTSIGKDKTDAVTLYAKFTADSYAITYELNGGTNGTGNPDTYTYGEGVSSLANASKDGYTFKGWFNAADGGTEIKSISATQTGAVTLYAQYEANTYGITYVLDGGTNAAGNPNSYTYGKGVSSFENASKPGFTFDAWYSDADFTNEVTAISEKEKTAVTLYAKFTANQYKVNYELNGGTNAESNPTEYTYGVGELDLAAASKAGYTFDGWYSDAAYTIKVEKIDTTGLENVTLYAKFTANKYTITYNVNGGTNAETNPVEYTYGVGVTEFADASRDGYTFDGWYKEASFATKVNEIGKAEMENVTLYAKFTPNTYNITYVLDGGTNASTNPATYTVGAGGVNLASASKLGYTFKGWFDAAEGGTQITAISENQYGDITLYAQYEVNTYDITYVLDGGTNGTGNPTQYTYGKGVDSFADASKEGHTFEGWYSDTNFSTKVTEIGVSQLGNLTLYAKFTPSTYSITYVLDGGTNASGNPSNYTYGIGVTSLANASKVGHTFEGWYFDEAYTMKAESISVSQTGDMTLYAKWNVNSYAISYELDGGKNAATNPDTYSYGVGVESFDAATKEGHTFAGWYTAAEGGTKVESISATQLEAVTLYARYTVNDYAIKYELNGGTNASGNPNSYTYGKGVSSFENASKPGFTFDGWYSDADFTNEVTVISETEKTAVTLYAKFTANQYKVNYELNGGTNAESNPTEYTYGVGELDLAAASKQGYAFDGWYSDAAYTTKVEKLDTTGIENVTLYAKFTANTYKITYVLDGGSNGNGNPKNYTVGTGVSSLADASKTGYIFKGWYDATEGGIQIESISKTQTGDVTLYAKFVALEVEPEEPVIPDDEIPEEETPEEEESVVISDGGSVSLEAGVAYTLSEGTWKVAGDDTIYVGGITFYVEEDAEYEFIEQ